MRVKNPFVPVQQLMGGDVMKQILITGKNSYIGTSLGNWLLREPDKYKVTTVDMQDESWKK